MPDNGPDFRLIENHSPLEIAAEWHMRMSSPRVTPEQRAAFEHWHADPENAANYAEFERVWGLMEPALERAPNAASLERLKGGRRPFPRYAAFAIAASLAAVLWLGVQYDRVWRFDIVASGTATSTRQLADGSRLILSPDAALNTDFANGQRRVRLARGQVFFDVVHDPQHPFIVDAGEGQVRVLGTAFTVQRAGDQGRVVVTRGKVRVQVGADSVDLTPGQGVAYAAGHEGPVEAVDAKRALAWTRGRLLFDNKPLREVLWALQPYYARHIFLLDREKALRPIDAAIDVRDIDGWLNALERTQKLKIRRLPGLTVLR
jgi:transmembrane sensor